MDSPVPQQTSLLNPAWWRWNEVVWGIRIQSFEFRSGEGRDATLRGALFLNRFDQIWVPPLNPHVPFELVVSGMSPNHRQVTEKWLKLSSEFVKLLKTHRLANYVSLPAGYFDARPFDWSGTETRTKYTYVIDFQKNIEAHSKSVGRKIGRAKSLGYHVTKSSDWRSIFSCLRFAEERKGFTHRLTLQALHLGAEILGTDCFRGYLALDGQGSSVGSAITIHSPGKLAIGLTRSVSTSALKDGVNQLMLDFCMADLKSAGAIGYDLAGANIRAVAMAKAEWGYPLCPYIQISPSTALGRLKRLYVKASR